MHPKLEEAIRSLQLMQRLLNLDIYMSVYDRDCTVLYSYPENSSEYGITVGSKYNDPTGALQKAIATGEDVFNRLPESSLGFSLEGNLVPVKDEDSVVGCIAVSYIPMNQKTLEAQQVALNSTYYLLLSVNPKTDKCIQLYSSFDAKQYPFSIVDFTTFRKDAAALLVPEDREIFLTASNLSRFDKKHKGKLAKSCECRIALPDGKERWVECTLKRTNNLDTEGFDVLLMVRDINERKKRQEASDRENQRLIEQLQIANDALFQKDIHDETVELYNRKGFDYYSPALFMDAKKTGKELFVYFADMNGLKFINDTFGHAAGDTALRSFAGILKVAAGDNAICARIGGDEFLVVGSFPRNSKHPKEIIRRIERQREKFNKASKLPYNLESSYGFFLGEPNDTMSIEECVEAADQNMYDMKMQQKRERSPLASSDPGAARALYYGKSIILIADEKLGDRLSLKTLFDDDCTIIEAKDGDEALETLQTEKHLSLALLSTTLPSKNTFRVVSEGRHCPWNESLPMLLIGASSDEITVRTGIDAGATDFIFKPINLAVAQQRIRAILAASRKQHQLRALLQETRTAVLKATTDSPADV